MHIKRYFITGLVILLPIAFTLFIVNVLFNMLTGPFLGAVQALFAHYHLFSAGFLFLDGEQLQNILAKLLILVSLFLVVLILGYIARWFFFTTFLQLTEYIVKRIPLVRTIYKITQEVIHTLLSSEAHSFKQVVLAKFPHKETYSLGFVTKEEVLGLTNDTQETFVAVFIPTTPNPTSGFLTLFPKKELLFLDMKVEEAFKFILSCGAAADFSHMTKQQSVK